MKISNQAAAVYQQIIQRSEQELQQVRQRIWVISLLRLFFFILAFLLAYLLKSEGWFIFSLVMLVPLLFFIWLVKRHNHWFYRKEVLLKIIEMNEHELRGLEYDFSAFDGGKEFIDPQHLYTYDLDVFGENSLFQAINRTSTPIGKQHLAYWLNNHLTHFESIMNRQEAICELTPQVDFRQQFRLQGLLYKGSLADMAEIQSWVNDSNYFCRRKLLRMLPVMAIMVNGCCISLSLLEILSFNWVGVFFLSFVLLSTLFSHRITKLQEIYGKKWQILSIYAQQILLIEKLPVQSTALQNLKGKLIMQGKNASQAVVELSRLMNALDQRNNLLIATILNGLSLWELRQVMRIEQWRELHAAHLPVWIDTVGEMEAYCSLATFAYNHADYIYPILASTPFELRAHALGHPLMPADKCVRNGVDILKKPFFIVVTGANMAGKSTYLRTVGVNYLLACIGAPVWASEMSLYPSQLVTSLRTTDSLIENESYFFAELKGLKRIIDLLEEGKELFIILDEILKGTNSMDKQKGSLALVKQFMQLNANGMIATHDLLLGSLAASFPQHIKNYCFEADIMNNELTFSYRIREGIAQNMNACFLMKKMGIVGLDE